jgi:hypothetical protein
LENEKKIKATATWELSWKRNEKRVNNPKKEFINIR